jgi:alpha-tubulin suppressor-like RCC1 family protein
MGSQACKADGSGFEPCMCTGTTTGAGGMTAGAGGMTSSASSSSSAASSSSSSGSGGAGGNAVVEIALGGEHSCARKQNGEVWCWGGNEYLQLGVPANNKCGMDPCEPKPVLLKDVSGPVDLAGGGFHTCAAKSDGTVLCWGTGYVGQLGSPTMGQCPKQDGKTCTNKPLVVPNLTSAVELALGGNHSCARRSDGSVWCWGQGDVGQLGASTGCTFLGAAPSPVVGQSAAASLGSSPDRFTCARQMDGTVYCWGNNTNGQLGAPSTCATYSQKPLLVPGVSNVVQVVAGNEHTCVRKADGTAQCWGVNEYGQLGAPSNDPCPQVPTQTCSLKPVTMMISGIAMLAASIATTCAVKTDGTVACVGLSLHGELGAPAPDSCGNNVPCSLKPVTVAGLTNVVEIAAGWEHFCARRKDGAVLCWGWNGLGQLGDGKTVDHATPTMVPL